MWLGRFQPGDSLSLTLQCVDGSGAPTLPTSAPTVKLYRDGSLIDTIRLPIQDRFTTTAYFQRRFRLDGDYTAGRYFALYQWTISGNVRQRADTFDVLSGGDPDGTVQNLEGYPRPEAVHMVYGTESGLMKAGRNPS